MSCTLLTSDLLLSCAAQCIPPMASPGGSVCIVGGSASQPGPANVAALAALRAGADRVSVLCADSDAASAVRSFWPQPSAVLEADALTAEAEQLTKSPILAGCQAVLVGPGLDASLPAIQLAAATIQAAIRLNKPLVIDGTALSAVADNPALIRGQQRVILTPNWSEFRSLCESVLVVTADQAGPLNLKETDPARRLMTGRLSVSLGGVCILLKGREDVAAVGAGSDSQAEICALQDDSGDDSERDFEAGQDKILLNELSQHAEAAAKARLNSRKRQSAATTSELLPVGLDSDNSTDDDDEDEDAAAVGQFRDLLKRARLQRLRKEVAEDMVDDDADDAEDADRDADRQWSTSRRYRYAAGDSDDEEEDEGDDDDEDNATTARLMREERERLRRRLLGVGLPSDLPKSSPTAALAKSSASGASRERTGQQLVRLTSDLPAYERPPAGVSLEAHLLSGDTNRWPDMRSAYEQKTRLEARLKPLIGKAESELTDQESVLKWHYILLCVYLRMRANGQANLHRHPVRRLLRRASDAVRKLGNDSTLNKKAKVASSVKQDETELEDQAKDKTSEQQQPGHRPIYWEMQKNLPVRLHKRRPRGVKKSKPGDSNPRVKLRDKFRKAMIKRRSQVPEVRPEANRYSGETSGIRAGLVKSRKFK